jgi:endonuclease I
MNIGTPPRHRALTRVCALLAIVVLTTLTQAQPAGYFATAEGLSGSTLKSTLRGIIDGHQSLSYTPGVWDAHKDLYEDPNDSSRLILFYSQASISKSSQAGSSSANPLWNREHLWPRSYGADDTTASNNDLFHLVPTYEAVNSDRSNNYFDNANPALSGYQAPAHPIAPLCKENEALIWEPGDGQKGWVSRSMFYMTTRYSHLSLSDTPSSTANRMGRLSTLLKWNRQFLPSDKEREVNQRIFDDYQGNRNPYIDFPEFADAVFVTGPSWGGWRLDHFTLAELLDPAISGDDADPDADGVINLIEMARYSDPRDAADGIPVEGTITGPSTVEISFTRATSSENLNLTLVLQVSTNLSNWSTVPLAGATIDPAGTNQESVTVTRTIAPGTAEFYRLHVVRP